MASSVSTASPARKPLPLTQASKPPLPRYIRKLPLHRPTLRPRRVPATEDARVVPLGPAASSCITKFYKTYHARRAFNLSCYCYYVIHTRHARTCIVLLWFMPPANQCRLQSMCGVGVCHQMLNLWGVGVPSIKRIHLQPCAVLTIINIK
jgi:hypothetical protein